jgi:5-methylthioadenosine/S-adenosylhomocysteine deaminase
MATSIIVKNAMIVTMDKERRIIRDGAIAIKDSGIAEVGKTEDILATHKADKVIDASGHLATPGLIDGHHHTSLFFPKGLLDPTISIGKHFLDISFLIEGAYTEEDVHFGALGLFIEMIKHGTTCFAEVGVHHDYIDGVANAMQEIGIRGTIAKTCRDQRTPDHPIPDKMFDNLDESLKKGEDVVKKWNGAANGLIRAHFGLRYNLTCSDEVCIKAKELADKYQTMLISHAAFTEASNEKSVKATGFREVERYEKLGIIDKNTNLIHMGYVNEQEIEIVKNREAKVCHCPLPSLYLGTGLIGCGKIPELIQAGVTVALGVDSVEVGFLDMVRTAHLAATAHNDARLKQNVISVLKAMEMLTIDGAKALCWDDQIGSIEQGKRADIVLFDTSGMEWYPIIDPVARLIFSADGSSASTVIIDGKIVMENRKILTVDEAQIRTAVEEKGFDLRKRIGITPELSWPII